jgi:hypothetical protein
MPRVKYPGRLSDSFHPSAGIKCCTTRSGSFHQGHQEVIMKVRDHENSHMQSLLFTFSTCLLHPVVQTTIMRMSYLNGRRQMSILDISMVGPILYYNFPMDLCRCLLSLGNLQSSATTVTRTTWHNTNIQS